MFTILGITAGSGLGFLYHRYIGCKSGTCLITSNRFASMAYGALLGVLLINSFSFAQSPGNDILSVDNKTFAQKMKEKNVVVLDVRTPGEFNSGHLKGARLLDVNNHQFASGISKLDKTKTYLVYCRSGARSMQAIRKMKAAGFTRLVNLDGGILGWDGTLVR